MSESPFFVRFFLGQDGQWPGDPWFIMDMVVFWAGLLGGGRIAGWGLADPDSATVETEG